MIQPMRLTYLIGKTQNELINIIGNDIILRSVVDEIKKAKYFTVLADEITSHNKEILALYIRFVDINNEIREEFLPIMELKRTTGVFVGREIVHCLDELGLYVQN